MSDHQDKTRPTGLLSLVAACLLAGCVPQLARISARNPDLFEKEADKLVGASRGVAPSPPPSMYVKQKNTVIRPVDQPRDTGSLFNPDDGRNYLFATAAPTFVGQFLKIKVVPMRADQEPPEQAAGAASPPGKTSAAKAKDKETDQVEAELLKSLPELTPAEKGGAKLVPSFKMQVMHRYPNGDVLARVVRRSRSEDQAKEFTAEARIPAARLTAGDALTTDDLLDVHVRGDRDGGIVESSSPGWEDEYSLRMSGFTEAKSKAAETLAEGRRRLKESRGKLEDQIKTFGAERRQVAKQRDELARKQSEQEQKLSELESKVQDQESTIEDQKGQIDDLSGDNPKQSAAGNGGAKKNAKSTAKQTKT